MQFVGGSAAPAELADLLYIPGITELLRLLWELDRQKENLQGLQRLRRLLYSRNRTELIPAGKLHHPRTRSFSKGWIKRLQTRDASDLRDHGGLCSGSSRACG